jgi:hypothetical protein
MTGPIVAACAEELPPHYPMLKNPQNAPAPNSSIWAATLGISADCALKARRTVTGGRLSANAGSQAKISQRVSVASTIVIESKIRVFQHNLRTADAGVREADVVDRDGDRGRARQGRVLVIYSNAKIGFQSSSKLTTIHPPLAELQSTR